MPAAYSRMNVHAQAEYLPPKTWQQFEELCADTFATGATSGSHSLPRKTVSRFQANTNPHLPRLAHEFRDFPAGRIVLRQRESDDIVAKIAAYDGRQLTNPERKARLVFALPFPTSQITLFREFGSKLAIHRRYTERRFLCIPYCSLQGITVRPAPCNYYVIRQKIALSRR
jgi:hypothetical protein